MNGTYSPKVCDLNGSLETLPSCESSFLRRPLHKSFPFVLFGSRLLTCHCGSNTLLLRAFGAEIRSGKKVVI